MPRIPLSRRAHVGCGAPTGFPPLDIGVAPRSAAWLPGHFNGPHLIPTAAAPAVRSSAPDSSLAAHPALDEASGGEVVSRETLEIRHRRGLAARAATRPAHRLDSSARRQSAPLGHDGLDYETSRGGRRSSRQPPAQRQRCRSSAELGLTRFVPGHRSSVQAARSIRRRQPMLRNPLRWSVHRPRHLPRHAASLEIRGRVWPAVPRAAIAYRNQLSYAFPAQRKCLHGRHSAHIGTSDSTHQCSNAVGPGRCLPTLAAVAPGAERDNRRCHDGPGLT